MPTLKTRLSSPEVQQQSVFVDLRLLNLASRRRESRIYVGLHEVHYIKGGDWAYGLLHPARGNDVMSEKRNNECGNAMGIENRLYTRHLTGTPIGTASQLSWTSMLLPSAKVRFRPVAVSDPFRACQISMEQDFASSKTS